MAVVRVGAAVLFVLLVAAPFGGFRRDTWDVHRLAVLLGLVSVVIGVVIGRGWAVALPLAAVAFAVVWVASSAIAGLRGGGLTDERLGVAGVVCLYSVPGMAFGVGLVAVGAGLEV